LKCRLYEIENIHLAGPGLSGNMSLISRGKIENLVVAGLS
jgi:hypothetical protein